MPFEEQLTFNQRTGVAYVDLSAKQFYAVTETANGLDLATAAKNISGILQDNPIATQAGAYAVSGVTKAAISASTAITKGARLEVDTGGTLITLASGTAVAEAREALSSTAAVCYIAVALLPNNAAFS